MVIRRRMLLLVGLLSTGLVLLMYNKQSLSDYGWLARAQRYEVTEDYNYTITANNSEYVLVTAGCRIQRTDDPDSGVTAMYRPVDVALLLERCAKRQPQPLLTTLNDDNQVVIDAVTRTRYDESINDGSFHCEATPIARDKDGEDGDGYRYETSRTVRFATSYNMTGTNFARVRCYHNATLVYTDFHAAVQSTTSRPELEQRYRRRFAHPDRPYLPVSDVDGPPPDDDRLSVVILTLDSVSRANFARQMPLTRQLLLSDDGMAGVEMAGYGKTGDNTLPILLALLTGQTSSELRWHCPLGYDGCPFIWRRFAGAGYRTAYAEDAALIHTFNMAGDGFRRQPTDDYLRPLYLAEYEAEQRTPWNPLDYNCFTGRPQFQVMLDWMRHLLQRGQHRPLFAYLHTTSVTHDELNWAQMLDQPLHRLLSEARAAGWLRRTALIILSDHGMRFGGVRDTIGGRLEENLPLLTITMPAWWRQRHRHGAMAALKINSRRLVTPFDVHRTLLNLLDANFGPNSGGTEDKDERGLTLFRPISAKRTCLTASIPEHYCPCRSAQIADPTAPEVVRAADAVVAHVNEETASQRHLCAALKRRGGVRHSYRLYDAAAAAAGTLAAKPNDNVMDWLVTVETEPGGAWLEGTVRLGKDGRVFRVQDVSRTNSFGKQAACLHGRWPELRKFCFCDHRTPAPNGSTTMTANDIEANFKQIVKKNTNST